MPQVSYTRVADIRRAANNSSPSKGEAANLKFITATKSVASGAQNSTLRMMSAPSNARIAGISRIHWDDLASTGSPTLDAGVAPTANSADFTADADALNDGLDIASSASNAALVKDHANYGKQLWEFVSGLTSDPGGDLDIYVSIVDAASNATGDITVELAYTID